MANIKISDHFTAQKMLWFAIPCIGMQLVDNTYQMVDGYFVSNVLGEEVFAAENMIFPPIALLLALGLVLGAGGSAIIAYYLGEGKDAQARQTMSMISLFLLITGSIISAVAFAFMPYIAALSGATKELVPYCTVYGRVLALFMPVQMLNYAFQEYLVVADEGKLGFVSSVVNAVSNIILDYLFLVRFNYGLVGVAAATGMAWCFSLLVSLIYFFNKKHNLHFVLFKINLKDILQSLLNGSSEMVDAVSYAIVGIIFNRRLIELLSARGVASFAVTEYVSGVFVAVLMGFGIAIIPVFGYRFGEKNYDELKRLRNTGLKIVVILGVIMTAIAIIFSSVISGVFVGYDEELKDMATYALRICGLAYTLCGINMFSSSVFTGVSDGLSSAIIAFLRSFIMPIIFIFALPAIFENDAVWFTSLCSEIVTIVFVALLYRIRFPKKGEQENE
ncbi:MAG: MATE family efflux transporter [Butyrivibrio sp.]|uniref:MATE family efflux transporter n=1 Tax=Butyrivibrio sp. TaxID=28121 RepID=UPI0025E390EE|nr:MATE family efflux transporter [Butyrivibrio sp.]MCR5772432.1 MATE family efflux transporter [Butyrivibrio sp.]